MPRADAERRELMSHQQTWDDAIDRFEGLGADNDFGRQMIGLLRSLRVRWEAAVNVDTSMFDLTFSARGRPKTTTVWLERSEPGQPESAFVVSLRDHRPRLGLDQAGGRLVIAGDHCRPENAKTVVESFLLQLASPPSETSEE